MNKAQLSTAVSFFKSLLVFLHFKTYVQLVFTNPQYFLDALSSIIQMSFVDFPEKFLDKGKIMPPDAHCRLQQENLNYITIKYFDLLMSIIFFIHPYKK